MRCFLLFICLSFHLFAGSFDEIIPSSPDEIASLNDDLLVRGFVSAISGQISLSEMILQIMVSHLFTLILTNTLIPLTLQGEVLGGEILNR